EVDKLDALKAKIEPMGNRQLANRELKQLGEPRGAEARPLASLQQQVQADKDELADALQVGQEREAGAFRGAFKRRGDQAAVRNDFVMVREFAHRSRPDRKPS